MIKNTIKLKIGDNIKIISGKDKNKISYITKIIVNKNQVIIKNLNKKIKSKKFSSKDELGKKQYNEFPINSSNVKIIKN